MAMRTSIDLYLRYCVAATAAVVVIPLLIVAGVAFSVETGTPIAVAVAVGAGMSLLAAVGGSYLWRRRPESMDLCFGELMIWSYVRRRRAEQHIEEGAEILGLDRRGRPLRRTQMTKEQRLKILHDLAVALETKDPYTHGHSTRVEELVAQTAAGLKLSDEEIAELRVAASLHDVGKIRVPNHILRKPDRLTIDEQLIVQEHSSVGAWMVAGVSNGNIVASVRHHHERWDGNGYPDGLAGSDIPLFARVIAVADAYDAMTSSRPYRASMTRHEAIEEIERLSGEQFDPKVVDAFLATLPRRVPLAALVGLGFLGRFLRRGTSWAARYGTGSVTPGVASVGAASVVVASLFTPPAAVTMPAPQPAEDGVVSGSALDLGEQVNFAVDPEDRADRSLRRAGTRGKKVGEAKANVGSKRSRDKKGSGNEVLGSTVHRRGGDGDGPGRDSHAPPAETPPDKAPPKDPPPSDPPADPLGPPQPLPVRVDPQPEKGRDCPEAHPGRGRGGGTTLHCG